MKCVRLFGPRTDISSAHFTFKIGRRYPQRHLKVETHLRESCALGSGAKNGFDSEYGGGGRWPNGFLYCPTRILASYMGSPSSFLIRILMLSRASKSIATNIHRLIAKGHISQHIRRYSRIQPPPPAVVRVSNNIAQLGSPKEPPKPRQLMSLPSFPGLPLPGKKSVGDHVTAISWVKYYFDEISDSLIQSHFNKDLAHVEEFPGPCSDYSEKEGETNPMRKIKDSDIMSVGARVFLPVSVAETKVSKRFDTIRSGTSCPNADEINYLQRLVKYKDSSILVLNKPPTLPVKGNLPVHNSMDALAAAALCYDYDEEG